MARSRRVDGYEEWIMGRHMPYIVDEQEELIEYVVRHHESAYHENFRPNKRFIHDEPLENPLLRR